MAPWGRGEMPESFFGGPALSARRSVRHLHGGVPGAWRGPGCRARSQFPTTPASQFYPQFAFLARSLATGQSPFWTPNIFAGWPQIADPQSLIFSPLHLILALLDPEPKPALADALVFALLYAGGAGVILFFRDRGWHVGGALVAALAFCFGGSAASRIQHIGQIESLVFLPLALWLLARALERSSWRGRARRRRVRRVDRARPRSGVAARGLCAGRLCALALAAADRAGWRAIVASLKPLAAGAVAGALIVTVPVVLTALLAAHSNRPEIGYAARGRGSLHPANLLMLVFADLFGASDFNRELLGAAELCLARRVRADRPL